MENVEETQANSEAVSPAADQRAPGSRRDAILFVVVFLTCTFASLAGYRYLGGTKFMDWYLYQIASHTRTVLSLAGEKCGVEDPALLSGRVAQVREALHSKTDASVPLTSWEAWRYRAITAREEARKADEALRKFSAVPWAPPRDAAARLVFYRERLTRVQTALSAPDGSAALPIDQDMAARIGQLEPALTEVNWNNILASADPNKMVSAIDEALQNTEARAESILERRALELDSKAREEGPRIAFVYRSGTGRQIADLQLERTAIQNDAKLDDAARQKRLAAIDARLHELTAKASKDANQQKDIAFVFRVVADCGAIPSMAIFLSAVLAFPAAWRKRLLGILIGIPVLYVINVVRLACLAGLGAYAGAGPLFDFAHHYVWQGIYIAFVVAVWLLWVEYLVREKPSCQNATP